LLAKKKKLSKREIKEDKLVTTMYKAQEFYEEYKNYIIYGAGAIVVLVIAIMMYTTKLEEDNVAANQALAQAIPLYEAGNYQDAINGQPGTLFIGLKQIVDKYSGSANGEYAKIYLANSYYFIGEFKAALKVYEDFNGDDPILSASAIAGSANCYEELKNYSTAAKYYEKAATISEHNNQNAYYLLRSGINYISAGDKTSAKDIFEKLKNEYDGTPASREADRYSVLTVSN